MITARDEHGNRILAVNNDGTKNTSGFCPCCRKPLIAKVGSIRRPHWAHESVERCDEWKEDESDWHYKWREQFVDCKSKYDIDIENVIEKGGKKHFYDARIDNRLSIVLPRMRLSGEQKREYENFFGEMVWIVGAKRSEYKLLRRDLEQRKIKPFDGRYKSCYWMESSTKNFFDSWKDCARLVAFDFSEASDKNENDMWTVLPEIEKCPFRYIVKFSTDEFVKRILGNGNLFRKSLSEVITELDRIDKVERKTRENDLTRQDGGQQQDDSKLFCGNEALGDYWSKKRQ